MKRTVISRGKTVTEAVNLGLELLGVTKENANIEIIETGSKGLFGIRSKPASVKVSVIQPSKQIPGELISDLNTDWNEKKGEIENYLKLNPSPRSVEGKVWVEEGRIMAQASPDNYPLISPVTGAQIRKNGTLIDQTVTVTELDQISITLDEDRIEPVWKITVDEDLMKVTLSVIPGYRLYRRLLDSAPSAHLIIEFEEIRQPISIVPELITSFLRDQMITYGILYDNILKACNTTEPGSFPIALGLLPIQGTNGSFEKAFDTLARNVQPKTRNDGTVDYREIKEFPTVSEGQILGQIKPPVSGTPGVNVKGEDVPPLPVSAVVPLEGKGTIWTENGTQAVAIKAGMPQIHQHGLRVRVAIIPKLLHGGDVNMETGNIHFQGDVEITGSVQDNMKIEASGSILVHGNANMSNLNASQSLIVHANIISSKITVGKGSMLHAEMEPMLKEISVKMRSLKSAIEQISQAAAFKMNDFNASGLRPLLNVLLRGKFKSFNDTLHQLNEKINLNKSYLDEDWHLYAKQIHSGFLNTLNSHFRGIGDLEDFQQVTEYLHSMVEPPVENSIFAKFNYAHNSNIYSGGDISISQGCYNSMVYCQGYMEVYGFLKGGVYFANRGLIINEAGTEGNVTTKLHTPEGSDIQIRKAYTGTTVQIGKQVHTFTKDTLQIHARLNEEGELILS